MDTWRPLPSFLRLSQQHISQKGGTGQFYIIASLKRRHTILERGKELVGLASGNDGIRLRPVPRPYRIEQEFIMCNG